MSNRPNLFVIGAAKSATTTICSQLQQHPDIFFSTPKEPGFFCEKKNWHKGYGWYESLFENAGNRKIIAEGSTFYTQRPTHENVVPKILKYAPNASFLYVVRNPFDRIISHYWYDVQRHYENKRLIDAIKTEPRYIENGNYAYQLKPYIEAFGHQAIHVVSYEDYFTNPKEKLREILVWLKLDETLPNANDVKHLNKGAKTMEQIRGQGRLYRFSKSSLWRELGPFVPSRLKALARKLALKEVHRDDGELAAAREYLEPILKEQVADFEKLLSRSFPEWDDLFKAQRR